MIRNFIKARKFFRVNLDWVVNRVVYSLRGLSQGMIGEHLPTGYYTDADSWSEKGKTADEFFELIYKGEINSRRAPKCATEWLSQEFVRQQDGRQSSMYKLEVNNSRVVGIKGVLVCSDGKVIGDVTFEYGRPPGDHPVFRKLCFPKLKYLKGVIGVVHSPSPSNYYHWVYEVIPQLMQLRDLMWAGKIGRILVPKSRLFQKQWLNLLGIKESQIINLEDSSHYKIEKVVVFSMPSRNGELNPFSVDIYRKLMRDLDLKSGPRRVLILRDVGSRRMLLGAELLNILETKFGFTSVHLEKLNVLEQIHIFNGAEVVMASHGAGLTGMAFMRPGTQVLEILSPSFVNLCYWKVACSLGLKYSFKLGGYKGGISSGVMPPQDGKKDVEVERELLEELLANANIGEI